MPRTSLRPLAAVALLFGASGCDSTSEPPSNDGEFQPGCEQSTATRIDPTGTYLRTNGDNASSPTVIRLADLGISPGTQVELQRLGEYQYQGRGDVTLVREQLVGVFSSSAELLPSNVLARVPGAINAGSSFVTPPTANGSLPTDIPQDFLVERTRVPVPAGAQFLFLSPVDDLFEDNLDSDEDYRVCVTRLG